MRFRKLLALLLPFSICGFAFAQSNPQDVLVPGDPPLTQSMADDYARFIQWSLQTPLTVEQQKRVTDYLITNWKAGDKNEIARTLNILSLRKEVSSLNLQDNSWAPVSMRKEALHYWKASPSTEMAVWGTAIYNASHLPLVDDTPPLTRQMEDAYIEMGLFMIGQVDGAAPSPPDAVDKMQIADGFGNSYKSLTAEQKQNFADLPKAWVQLREAWPTLDAGTKASLIADWKSHLYPSATPKSTASAKVAKGKPVKPQPAPPVPTNTPLSVRLAKMQWVLSTPVFTKITSVGTPYGTGW